MKPQEPTPGTLIDERYRIIEKIGGGGMGAVYRAEQIAIQRTVALKLLHSKLFNSGDEEFLVRFEREAKTASTIDHPNAVPVFDYGIVDEMPYLVMKYVEGPTLKEVIKGQPEGLPLGRMLLLTGQICGALGAAHAAGIVHRDLKPENIIIAQHHDGGEWAQVLDFGIAKVLAADGAEDSMAMTETGRILGTPKYISPEQARGRKVDWRTDIYSLGVIVYEMLSGTLPFTADSSMDLLMKHVNDPPPSLLTARPELGIPDAVDKVVLQALQKDPELRQQSAEQFFTDLSEACRGKLNPAETVIAAQASRKQGSAALRGGLIVGGGSLAAVLCLAAIGYLSAPESEQHGTSLQAEQQAVGKQLGDIAVSTEDGALHLRDQDEQQIAALIEQLASSNEQQREEAATRLQLLGSRAVPALIEALEHSNKQVRYMASAMLGVMKASEAVAPLVKVVAQDQDLEVAGQAAHALRQIGGEAHQHLPNEVHLTEAKAKSPRLIPGGPPEGVDAAVFHPVHFPSQSSELHTSHEQELEQRIAAMKKELEKDRELILELQGHTDHFGGFERNVELGLQRAKYVAQKLIAGGIAADRIKTVSHAHQQPLAEDTTPQAVALNNRVQFHLSR